MTVRKVDYSWDHCSITFNLILQIKRNEKFHYMTLKKPSIYIKLLFQDLTTRHATCSWQLISSPLTLQQVYGLSIPTKKLELEIRCVLLFPTFTRDFRDVPGKLIKISTFFTMRKIFPFTFKKQIFDFQGLMFGYATDETEECMPLTVTLSHKLNKKIAELRRDGTLWWARPDSKTQVNIYVLEWTSVRLIKNSSLIKMWLLFFNFTFRSLVNIDSTMVLVFLCGFTRLLSACRYLIYKDESLYGYVFMNASLYYATHYAVTKVKQITNSNAITKVCLCVVYQIKVHLPNLLENRCECLNLAWTGSSSHLNPIYWSLGVPHLVWEL